MIDFKRTTTNDFSELYAKTPKKTKLELSNVKKAFFHLGLQDNQAPCILVAGTNGKGTTAGLLWHLQLVSLKSVYLHLHIFVILVSEYNCLVQR